MESTAQVQIYYSRVWNVTGGVDCQAFILIRNLVMRLTMIRAIKRLRPLCLCFRRRSVSDNQSSSPDVVHHPCSSNRVPDIASIVSSA